METGIEATFVPETVNEVLLMGRIRELHMELFKCGYLPPARGGFSSPKDIMVVAHPPQVTLHIAASVEALDMAGRKIVIRGQSYGPNEATFGFANYVSKDTLMEMPGTRAADWLGELHKETIHKLAKLFKRA